MDSFLEYLMIKKLTGKDIALRAALVFLAVLLSLIIFVAFMTFRILRPFSFFAVLCIGYLAYILITRQSIEYEYIFTNGHLDIDIIRGRKFRKRLTSIKCKNIRIMEKTETISAKTATGEKAIVAVYNPSMGEIYKIEAAKGEGKDVLIFFQPPEKLINEMKKFNPRNIITD